MELLGKYTFRIFRYNPEEGGKTRYDSFEMEVRKGMTVLDCLQEIKGYRDGTLSFRRSCRSAVCGSCAMNINGKNDLACHLQISAIGKKVITIDPIPGYPVEKDLIVNMDEFYRNLERVFPWLIRKSPFPDGELEQLPAEREKIDLAVNCILCGSCTSSCPSFWFNPRYIAPGAFLKAHRFVFDSRDEGKYERLAAIDNREGLWRCHTVYNCEEACPKDLKPNEAIAALKREAIREII